MISQIITGQFTVMDNGWLIDKAGDVLNKYIFIFSLKFVRFKEKIHFCNKEKYDLDIQ
jgi:hypothetical protein